MHKLRPFQKEALQRLEKSTHLVCIAPTGSGKSLIYERIAAEQGRRTLLISPLIALARQQAESLRELGVEVTLQAGASPKPPPPRGSGTWIISPESLQTGKLAQAIHTWNPDFLVVDECHCLYDWGDSFRKAFLEIPELIHRGKIPRSLWLTATLPPRARLDLERRIGESLQIMGEFAVPPNITLKISRIPFVHRPTALIEEIRSQPEAGIVFVNTRDSTLRLQNLIQATGRSCSIYHAGLGHEERCAIEARFRDSPSEILVSTSAFGMGMNYLNLRWTVLWQPPASLLALAQALGRVGRRTELPAMASLYWEEEDFLSLRWLFGRTARGKKALIEVAGYLEYTGCRVRRLEEYFNFDQNGRFRICNQCDFCLL